MSHLEIDVGRGNPELSKEHLGHRLVVMLTRMYDGLAESCIWLERVVERGELHEIGACSCYEHQIDLVCTNRLRSRLLGHALRLSETCSDT